MNSRTVIKQTLEAGLDDWIYLDEIVGIVRGHDPDLTGQSLVMTVLDVVRFVLDHDLMQVGEIPNGFVPWNLTTAQALSRVEAEWQPPGRELTISDICWLASTPAGDRLAESWDELAPEYFEATNE